MVYTLLFFFSPKCSLFHNSNTFGSCFIHVLYTGCAKIKKKNINSGAKRLILRCIRTLPAFYFPPAFITTCIHAGCTKFSQPSFGPRRADFCSWPRDVLSSVERRTVITGECLTLLCFPQTYLGTH